MSTTAAMSSSRLMELPHDILVDIFSRLPATSLMQFRCVSKSLRNLVDDPDLAAMHIALTNDRVDDVEVRVMPPSCTSYQLEFVSCGLLGLRWFGGNFGCPPFRTFGLYNPLRGEHLWLPEPEVDSAEKRYGLGFDSVTSTYKIVLIYSDRNEPYNCDKLKACVHVLGTSSWRRISSVPRFGFRSHSNIAYASGNMYWLACKNHIIYFDFGKEEFGWTSPPHLNFPDVFYLFLINLRGSLGLVDVNNARKKIEIWVLHKEKKQFWSKDYSITPSCFEPGKSPLYSVGAWEHGIYILSSPFIIRESSPRSTVVYYDLRCDSMRGVSDEWVEHRNKWRYVFSYTGSLISLKKYDSYDENYFQSEFPEHVLPVTGLTAAECTKEARIK